MEGAVLVQPLPIDRCRRGAEMNREDAVDHLQERLFGLARLVHRGAVSDRVTQCTRPLPQLLLQDGVHPRGVGGTLGFRHGALRDHAILVDQINKHVPLAPVTEQVAEQPVDCALISRSVGGFEDRLQEVIGLFEFIPEQ